MKTLNIYIVITLLGNFALIIIYKGIQNHDIS